MNLLTIYRDEEIKVGLVKDFHCYILRTHGYELKEEQRNFILDNILDLISDKVDIKNKKVCISSQPIILGAMQHYFSDEFQDFDPIVKELSQYVMEVNNHQRIDDSILKDICQLYEDKIEHFFIKILAEEEFKTCGYAVIVNEDRIKILLFGYGHGNK